MNSNDQRDLEQYIDAELKGLPNLKAPSELRTQVMSRISARTPVALRSAQLSASARSIAFAFVTLIVAAMVWMLYLPGSAAVAHWFAPVNDGIKDASLALAVVRTLLEAAVVVGRNLGSPVTIALITIAGISYLACVGLGTMCYRLAFAGSRNYNS